VIRRRMGAVLLALVLVAGLAAACSSARGGTPAGTRGSDLNDETPGGLYAGFGLQPPQPRPAFSLVDTNGKPFSFAQRTAGSPTLLYFGYTHCPDVCPTTMADIAVALQHVAPAVRNQTYLVFVTTDVKRDTGPVIAAWLHTFSSPAPSRFIGLRGSQAQIDAAQAAAHVMLATDDGQTHAAQVLLYGADDYARVSYAQSDSEADLMAHDLPLVARK
jgi:protein SCO1